MTNVASYIDTAPPLLVALTAFALLTGAFRLADPEGRSGRRGVGGPALIAAGLMFLYVGIAVGGGVPHLEQTVRDFVTGLFI
ncbi:hypothetical protein PARPLA_01864 [Rhodobacteraceae bacterium THAF1]|uniref:hypothetical protein n=1 Tax=Palleronia sp. THAF1 TaxID=2587842 RepID=UPI000F3AE23F|nr:hypothetical protein [Palleronia sp. THAF1]QFU09001.1 hypothetical protein FIU81_09980 [Palleronia sp. THAF1]VDC24260.1 hypothetical protein PARPLA_01864 [Rhodobacteraceae bacterium THAF1]